MKKEENKTNNKKNNKKEINIKHGLMDKHELAEIASAGITNSMDSNNSGENVKTHIKTHKTKYMIAILIAILIFLSFQFYSSLKQPIITTGDKVSVDYVGMLADGTVFDTSLPNLAQNSLFYNPQRRYEPFQFIIGQKQVLSDFETAVIKMKKGEKVSITIPKERAYPYDSKNVASNIPIEIMLKTSYIVPKDEFEKVMNVQIGLNKEYSLPTSPLKMKVRNIEGNNVTFVPIAKLNEEVSVPYRSWTAKVTEINETDIVLIQNVKVGDKLSYNGQAGSVVAVASDVFTVDFNLPIAGKDLIFTITLIDVIKKE